MKLRMALIAASFVRPHRRWRKRSPAPQHATTSAATHPRAGGSGQAGIASSADAGEIGSGERSSDPAFDGHYRNIEDGRKHGSGFDQSSP